MKPTSYLDGNMARPDPLHSTFVAGQGFERMSFEAQYWSTFLQYLANQYTCSTEMEHTYS